MDTNFASQPLNYGHPAPPAGYGHPPPSPYYHQAPPPVQQQQQTSNNVVVVQSTPQTTVITTKDRPNHVLHCLITFFCWPWIFVWLLICCIYGC